jgi:Tfp pilus assembly protein PilN
VIPSRIGLYLDNGRLRVAALSRRGRLEHFAVEGAEDPAATLAAELDARGLSGRWIRVGLDRRLAVIKAIDLPRAAGDDIGAMVGFELERHVPFPAEGARFAWLELPSGHDEPHRVLVAAMERRAVERPIGLLARARRRAASIVVACHQLPALLASEPHAGRVVWAHRHHDALDLLFLEGGRLLMSRRVTAEDVEGLAREIRRSLPLVRWSGCEVVWLSGDDAPSRAEDLAPRLGAAVSTPPYAARWSPLIAALPAEDGGAALLALALAAAPRRPVLDLLPPEARPWTLSRAQLVTAGMIGVAALLGLGLTLAQAIKAERYLDRVSHEIRLLDPQVKAVEGLAAEFAQGRRMLSALRTAQETRIPALPVLQELTETLPAGAWLQGLTMDGQGVELVGQSDAASALIPLLEASDRLERVEFTSPVTKTQNKEQFRIRASWERAAAPTSSAPVSAAGPTSGSPTGGEGRVRESR